MAVAGIIAEYNPFHRGHAWQIEALRERLGSDTAVVAVMSGNYVQRGDFAICSKHARAEMAILGGVDLVLELPTPWASATAERFAQGAVAILKATGIATHLAFGCESGDLSMLSDAAAALNRSEYPELVRSFLARGMTFAAARQEAVRELAGEAAKVLSRPNNALAVEYLCALAEQDSGIVPLALPRIGADHDSAELGSYPSASAIRNVLISGGDWKPLVSKDTAAIMEREMEQGRAPATMRAAERAILAKLRSMEEDEFKPFDGGGEGLFHRFYSAVRTGRDVESVLETAKTKRYPLARLRRMLLHSYLGVAQAAQGEKPPYIRVLGAGERGRMLLRQMSETAQLPVITRPADARKLERSACALFERESACTDLYTLAMPDFANTVPDSEFKVPAVMVGPKGERRTQ